jgi:hypothetical protein
MRFRKRTLTGQRSGFPVISFYLEPLRLVRRYYQSKTKEWATCFIPFPDREPQRAVGLSYNRRLNSFAESIIVNVGDCS